MNFCAFHLNWHRRLLVNCWIVSFYLVFLCSAPEPQVMDYQTQQYKLFPLVATAYVYLFLGRKMEQMYTAANAQFMRGNTAALPEVGGHYWNVTTKL